MSSTLLSEGLAISCGIAAKKRSQRQLTSDNPYIYQTPKARSSDVARVCSATQVQQDHAEENYQAARQNGPNACPFLKHPIANSQREEDFGLLDCLDV